MMALLPVLPPDEFVCLTALVWLECGDDDPIAVAEWSVQYQDDDNQ